MKENRKDQVIKGVAEGLDPFYQKFPEGWFATCEVYPTYSVRFEYGKITQGDGKTTKGWVRESQIAVLINPEGRINWYSDTSKLGLVEKVLPKVNWEAGGKLSREDVRTLNLHIYNGFFRHLEVMESCGGKKVTWFSELRKRLGNWIKG